MAASTDEREKISKSGISERRSNPNEQVVDPTHPPQATHVTPEMEAADRLRLYDELSKKSREASKAAAKGDV
jgi:hypothetical protein